MPTMKEMATSLGVSRQAIYKALHRNGIALEKLERKGKVGQAVVYSDDAAEIIFDLFQKGETVSPNQSTVETDETTEATPKFTKEQRIYLLEKKVEDLEKRLDEEQKNHEWTKKNVEATLSILMRDAGISIGEDAMKAITGETMNISDQVSISPEKEADVPPKNFIKRARLWLKNKL